MNITASAALAASETTSGSITPTGKTSVDVSGPVPAELATGVSDLRERSPRDGVFGRNMRVRTFSSCATFFFLVLV